MSKILAVNAGSSSLKFKLFEAETEKVLASGIADRIGHEDGIFKISSNGNKVQEILPIMDHARGVELLLKALIEQNVIKSLDEITGIGHRIVQGGPYFDDSVIVDDKVESLVESLIPLAPLHNAAHLVGYRAFKKALPNVKNVFVFDTAFHQTMAKEDYLYPISHEYADKYMVRKYGAHGTSHKYLSLEAKKYFNNRDDLSLITCHIGSGASLCAIKNGKCVTTSMGLTPLAGIMMGTRCGDIDPSVMPYLVKQTGKSAEELYQEFNKKSGLLAISEISNDTRDIEEKIKEGDEKAILAGKMFGIRFASYLGSYFVRLGHVDAIIFSAGIGENSEVFRKIMIDECKEALGLTLDEAKNDATVKGKEGIISTPSSKIPLIVIPTDEELMICRDVKRLLNF